MSKGDNVQKILSAIGKFCGKWGLRRVPRSPSFLLATSRNGRFSPNLVTKRTSVSRRGIRKDFSKIFTLGVICPQNLKSKVGQTDISIRAGYRSRHELQRDTVYSTFVVQGPGSFRDRSTFLYDVRLRSYEASKLPNFRILAYFTILNL